MSDTNCPRPRKSLLVCDTQEFLALGVGLHVDLDNTNAFFCRGCSPLIFQNRVDYASGERTPSQIITDVIREDEFPPDILLLDLEIFYRSEISSFVKNLEKSFPGILVVVWSNMVSTREIIKLFNLGIKAILTKKVSSAEFQRCLEHVAIGSTYLAECFQKQNKIKENPKRLTPREKEIFNLVNLGHSNKDIARSLGITPGTVKIHMKNIFVKTGVKKRFGLLGCSLL